MRQAHFDFHGGSWGLGLIFAWVVDGSLSPWCLLLIPAFLVSIPGVTSFSWKRSEQ